MQRLSRVFLVIGGISLVAATALSAVGFHGLQSVLSAEDRVAWKWGTELQFHHSLGLILIALMVERIGQQRLLGLAGALMVVGILLFSGGNYLEPLGWTTVGRFVPFGGGCFMAGWALIAVAGLRARKSV